MGQALLHAVGSRRAGLLSLEDTREERTAGQDHRDGGEEAEL